MPREYKNLQKLMRGTELLPEINEDPYGINDLMSPTPQYNKFLENAREMVMDDRTKEYQESPDYKPDWNQAGKLYRALNPGLNSPEVDKKNWSEQSDFYKQLVDEGTVDRGPGLVPSVQKRWADGDNPNVVDRADINDKIIEQYMKDRHPEVAYNITLPYAEDMENHWMDRLKGTSDFTNKANMRRVIKDLTGEDLDKLLIDRGLKYSNAAGSRDLRTGEIAVDSPTNIKTAAHEALHQKYKDHDEYAGNERLPELQNSVKLDEAMRNAQRSHIPYTTNAQQKALATGKYYNTPEGESGFYYDKILELLKNKKRP